MGKGIVSVTSETDGKVKSFWARLPILICLLLAIIGLIMSALDGKSAGRSKSYSTTFRDGDRITFNRSDAAYHVRVVGREEVTLIVNGKNINEDWFGDVIVRFENPGSIINSGRNKVQLTVYSVDGSDVGFEIVRGERYFTVRNRWVIIGAVFLILTLLGYYFRDELLKL